MSRCMFATLAPMAILAVPTPWGDRHAKCVVTVPEGASIVTEDDGVSIRHANGEIEPVHVADECRQDGIKERATHKSANVPNGWLDNKAFTHNAGYSKFTGSFNVPSDPPQPSDSEILYYFFGMENLGGAVNILQPVLTWGDEDSTPSGGWSLWSWACCPSDITFNSKNIGPLEEGMIVDGVIEKTDAETWRIDAAFTDGAGQRKNATLLADLGRYTYNWADVTLEVYGVTSCGEHSSGEVKFTDLQLFDMNGAHVEPQWGGADTSSCGGRVTVHDSTSISIQHSTTPGITV